MTTEQRSTTSAPNNTGKAKAKFSFISRAAFIILFAAIGTYCILTSHAATLTGDINGDGTVTSADLAFLQASYGQHATKCITAAQYNCDLNSDGTVNTFDLSILLSQWGKTSGTGGAPVNTVAPYFTASTGGASCSNGCAIEGQQLSVTSGTWSNSPASYTYQWMDCTTTTGQPPTTGSCSNAAGTGATTNTYTVAASDVGKALAVMITATNSSGSTSTSLSGACNEAEMSSSSSVGPITQTAGCSPVSAVVATSTTGETFCTNALTTCGYGDPLNNSVGIPAGTSLTAYTGPSTITTAGTVITDAEITSTIYVDANNVTIKDSEFNFSAENGAAVQLASGVTGTKIEYDSIHGPDATAASSIFMAVFSTSSTEDANAVTIDHVDFYNGQRILSGPGTVQNSFCLENVAVPGAHYECIYEGGGGIVIDHNTLLSSPLTGPGQAGPIYLSTDFANLTDEQVTNNLLAGGGYTIYGGAPGSGYTTAPETDTGNRFSRIYYTTCGEYGPDAYLPSSYTWSNNTYDDTGSTVSP